MGVPGKKLRTVHRNKEREWRPRIGAQGPGDAYVEPRLVYDLLPGPCFVGFYRSLVTGQLSADNTVACPGPGGGGPPPPSPLDAAYLVWHWEITLPDPTVATSPPDAAITGLDTYLALGGPQTRTIDTTALGYTVHLGITSTCDVAWGDGTTTKGHGTQGGPYPSGDLRHQYTHRGTVTVEVTQRWTARWRAGGQSGVLADVLFTTAQRTMPVEEIQAVVTG